jgi:NAD(P)-dependent dehydrogenase (short-subunit alcohol dehydrogenase family)
MKVVAGSTNPDKVAALGKELGSGHQSVVLDVTDPASAQAAVELAMQKFGRLDALINAAGIMLRKPALDTTCEEFERVVRVNLTGSFLIAQAAGRAMLRQSPDPQGARGSIVLIASLNSYISLTEVLAYAASKSGVMGLTRGLANEWAPYAIRVNGIAPGVFPTDLNRALIEGTARGEWLKKHTPQDRFGRPEELVGAALYLLSPSASYTNGQTIIVDGGFLARGV